jgi:hypothetical protein
MPLSGRQVREAALCRFIINELEPILCSLTAMQRYYGNSSVACSSTAIVLQSQIHKMEARLVSLSSPVECDTRPTSLIQTSFE